MIDFYCFKCFLFVSKSKGNAHILFKFSVADGWARGRAGGQGQTSQPDIYYRILNAFGRKTHTFILKVDHLLYGVGEVRFHRNKLPFLLFITAFVNVF